MTGYDGRSDEILHEVYSRNIARVYRLCYLRLGNREDAEDASQNVFLRWMKSGRKFESAEHEKAYFIRAACNESANMKKNFWRLHRVDLEDIPESSSAVYDEHDDGLGLLRFLPPKYREVIYLCYYEEMSGAEIAKLLSRNESTVRTQLQTGREILRKALEKKGATE